MNDPTPHPEDEPTGGEPVEGEPTTALGSHGRPLAARDREATMERLLDAAVTVFASQGFEAAGVKEVASAAGANVSLINRYFGGKQGLLVAITERFVATKREGALPYPPQPTLEDELWCYLRHRLAEDTEHAEMVRLLVSRVAIDAQFRVQAMKGMSGGADANLVERLIALRRNGEVPADADLDELFSMVAYFSFSANFFGAGMGTQTPEQIERLFDTFSRTVANGLGS